MKNKKIIDKSDIFFTVIFLIILLIPILRFRNNEYSEVENRKLSEYNSIINKNGGINLNFGIDFENWLKEHFYLREKYIYMNFLLKDINQIIFCNNTVYNKRNNIMFAAYNDFKNKYDNKYLSAQIIENFDLLDKFCNENKIKLYILIVPSATDINPEELQPYKLEKFNKIKKNFIREIVSNSYAKIMYPEEEFLEKCKNSEKCFFKTDIHWTEYGAYIGYKALIARIQKDFPNVKAVAEEDFNIFKSKKVRSDWDRVFNNGCFLEDIFPYYNKKADEILDTYYTYYNHKQDYLLQKEVIDIPFKKQKNFYYPYGSDLRVLQIGTSGNENLTQFIPYTFKHVKYIRINSVKKQNMSEDFKIMKLYKDDILNYKPDIMIFTVITGNFYNIPEIFLEY